MTLAPKIDVNVSSILMFGSHSQQFYQKAKLDLHLTIKETLQGQVFYKVGQLVNHNQWLKLELDATRLGTS